MESEPLFPLLEPCASGARPAAERCAAALAASGRPGAGLLQLAPTWRREFAPLWAAALLADLALERGDDSLDRVAAAVAGDGSSTSTLARALEPLLGSGALPALDLRALVQARRDERLLGHHPSRQELTVALLRRGRALPRWWLRRCGGESERRLSLLEAGVLADQLARGLGSFASLLRRGRLCLSLEDLTRLRVPIASLAAPSAPPELRRAISEQIVWARERLAVAFALPLDLGPRHAPWAGAWLRSVEARLRAVERAHFDVLSRDALPSPWALRAALLGGALNWLPPRSVTERPARG